MSVLTLGAKGGAASAEVWERYADLGRWASWAPQINRVEASGARIAPGVTGQVFGPLGVCVDFAVDAVDEKARRWTWTVRRLHVQVRLEHAVRDHAAGAATSLTMEGALPLVLGYAPIAQLALYRLVKP